MRTAILKGKPMGHKNALERYLHIDYCLYNKYLTLPEIVEYVNHKLVDNGLLSVSLRTIRKDINDIQTLFSIEVVKGHWFTDDKVHYRYDRSENAVFTQNWYDK